MKESPVNMSTDGATLDSCVVSKLVYKMLFTRETIFFRVIKDNNSLTSVGMMKDWRYWLSLDEKNQCGGRNISCLWKITVSKTSDFVCYFAL